MRKLLLRLLVFSSFLGNAQQRQPASIDDVLDKFEKRNQVMGSVAFSKNGVQSYARAFGFADVETKTKPNGETKYRIGSISKTFTAAMIMQLVAEEKLVLEDKLARFFPTWPNATKITIEHLLRHESGIYNFGKSSEPKYQNLNPQSRQEVFEIFESAPIAFAPGKKVDYNNANFVVLSLIIEALDNRTFAESLAARIIAPLDLKNTQAGGTVNAKQNEAHCYFWKNGWTDDSDFNNESLLGAGAIVSSPSDVNVFMNALFTHQLLPKAQLQQMLMMKDGMGLGLNQFPFYDKIAFGHAGNLASFESFSAYFHEEKVAFTICLNGNRNGFNDILIEVLRAYFRF